MIRQRDHRKIAAVIVSVASLVFAGTAAAASGSPQTQAANAQLNVVAPFVQVLTIAMPDKSAEEAAAAKQQRDQIQQQIQALIDGMAAMNCYWTGLC